MINEIAAKLADNWPPHDVVVTCNDCDREIYSPGDVMPGDPGDFARKVAESVDHHHKFWGHVDMEVEIIPEKPVEEIDLEITVR
jgi:hypothetical protein